MTSDSQILSRLRWSARRVLLENDLIIERFFNRYAEQLNNEDVFLLDQLFDLSDNDLLDLFLSRKEPEGALDTPELRGVLSKLRQL